MKPHEYAVDKKNAPGKIFVNNPIMKLKSASTSAVLAGLLPLTVSAQVITNAIDGANNYSTWPQTANNGTGFGNWSYNNAQPNGGFSGEFLGSSYTANGGGINSANGNAFGFYANSGTFAEAQATLPFQAGSLIANQTFSVQMQNHFIGDSGGQEGFSLQNSSGGNIFQFYFNGGSSDYFINVWTSSSSGTQIDTQVPYTSSPLTLQYTQGSGDAWQFAVLLGNTTLASLSSASTGDLLWQNSVSQVDLFSLNGGDLGNQNDNVYYNNPMITTVPEPSTMMLGASGLAALLLLRRRR
jgi:MYXO-CTERM domain-containing protein